VNPLARFWEEISAIAIRQLIKVRRQPIMLFFSLFMPIIWLLMFTQTFARMADTPQFQASYQGVDYVAIFLPAVLIMTSIQASSQSGFSLVADIEAGSMDKLLTSPIYRVSYLGGKMLADFLRISVQAGVLLLLAVGLKYGLGWNIPFASGPAGALVIIVLAALFGVAFAGLSNAVALRTRNTEATMMISFTLTFPLLFVSTAMLPAVLLPESIQAFSVYNPVSYIADAFRSLIISGVDWAVIGAAFGVTLLVGLFLNGLAFRAFVSQAKG
jgi:ABC-2 type transport system permease protein